MHLPEASLADRRPTTATTPLSPFAGGGPPARSLHDTRYATCRPAGFLTGNGEHGAAAHEASADGRGLLDHHRSVLLDGTHETLTPDTAPCVERVRDRAPGGDYGDAAPASVGDAGTWKYRILASRTAVVVHEPTATTGDTGGMRARANLVPEEPG